jgi:hemoglobin
MRASLPSFLAGWSGGPRDRWDRNAGKCVVSLHAPYAIDRDIAGQWADAVRRAVFDSAPADDPITEALADVLGRMALGMAKG